MRELDFSRDFDLIPLARPPHRRHEIPRAIHREDRRIVVRRDEEGACHVRAVVFDVVELRAERRFGQVQVLGELRFERADFHRVAQAIPHQRQARTAAEGEQRRLHQVGFGVARDADMVEVGGGDIRLGEHVVDSFDGEARPVFDPVESFFFGGGDQDAVADQAGGRAAVICINAEDVHRESLMANRLREL